MNDIDALLRRLASEDARVDTPAQIGADVLRAWRSRMIDAPRTRWRWVLVPVSAAISLVVGIVLVAGDVTLPPLATGSPAPVIAASPALTAPVAAEVAVDTPRSDRPSRLRRQAATPEASMTLSVVRVRMARTALLPLGIQLADPEAAGLVDVDVVVGEDGIAQSIHRITLVAAVQE